ncbi:hypothetical protein B7494_g495 [Chlorociboria aeruginascens]|nr:hypothetical protein B7494_g495 [Chlorociboria aeruginascens]
MSRSSFFRRSSRDDNPLLSQNNRDVNLQDLSPQPSPPSHGTEASSSPPPSFYISNTSHTTSPSRPKPRKIQFAAPPPPIGSSVVRLPFNHALSLSQAEPPEPGVSSTATKKRLYLNTRSSRIDPLLALERKEQSIKNELQTLLDAQSAGLVRGFGGDVGGGRDGSSDAGSSTPTTSYIPRGTVKGTQGSGIVPVRQPKEKTISLRGARKGLLRNMEVLVSIKREQLDILVDEIQQRGTILARVVVWEKRIEGARGKLNEYRGNQNAKELESGGEEGIRITELKAEERAVDAEIQEMEDRLAQMRAKKRWLGERVREEVNKREARLSSYRGVLREVEAEVQEFLRWPPIPTSVVMGAEEGFMVLPAHRRTLAMAREWWNKEISQFQQRKLEVEKEKSALEEGIKTWESTIEVVRGFEDDLRAQMATNVPETLKDQVGKMKTVIDRLDENAKFAEDKGWNLLICAIGAELEAFREGETILRGALESLDSTVEQEADRSRNAAVDLDGINGVQSVEREDSEDDGPTADLLIEAGDLDDTSE